MKGDLAVPCSKRKFITQQEMADEVGVDRGSIKRWMDNQGLQYIYVGGQRKVTRELWEDFLEKRTMTGPLVDPDDD